MRQKNCKLIGILACLVFFCICSLVAISAFAQKEDCLDSLRIYEKSDAASLDAQTRAAALDYYFCQACADNNMDQCRYLGLDEYKRCPYNFKLIQKFFLLLALNHSVNADVIRGCLDSGFGPNQKWCKDFVSAFVNKDVTFCNQPLGRMKKTDCAAVINLNEDDEVAPFYKDIILYLKAINSYDLNFCKKMSDKYFRTSCMVNLSNDKNICKKSASFEYLKNKYCKEKKEGKKNEKTNTQKNK